LARHLLQNFPLGNVKLVENSSCVFQPGVKDFGRVKYFLQRFSGSLRGFSSAPRGGLVDFSRDNFRLENAMATITRLGFAEPRPMEPLGGWELEEERRKKAREYAQELRDLRRRLNILPLQRIPVNIGK
jgi:hypothetical protein